MIKRKDGVDGPDYLLCVAAIYKDTEQEYRTVVHLQTTREFASFRYELGIEEEAHGKTLRYRVKGLNAPHLSLPGSGPAFFHREYKGLLGTYQIIVEGLDRKSTAFEFDISEKLVVLKHSAPSSFVHATTEFHG